MTFLNSIFTCNVRYRLITLSFFFIFAACYNASAQEPPPSPVKVTVTAQNLSFGAFYQGAIGGTITINQVGSRSATGDIILLNLGYAYSTALFQLVANPGTVISILNGSDISLNGSNGGTMLLHIGDSDPASPFVINTVPPVYTPFNVGGSLTVSNPLANPPGNYSGTFAITFVQE